MPAACIVNHRLVMEVLMAEFILTREGSGRRITFC